MLKRKINVIYNSDLDKKELYFMAKNEINEIYNNLKKSSLEKKEKEILNIYFKLDKNKDNYFRILFFLSLFCSYFHKIKHKINVKKLTNLQYECYKKHNFFILDIDNSHEHIMKQIITYFNTDSNNLEPITGKILFDLYNIDVQLIKK
jgi:hypothetical protein